MAVGVVVEVGTAVVGAEAGTAVAVGLLRFTVGAAGVAGMAEAVGFTGLLPMVAWPI
jgi:hypothetical protein